MYSHENKDISEKSLTKILDEAVKYAASCVQFGSTQFAKLEKECKEKPILINNALYYFREEVHTSPQLLRIEPDDQLYVVTQKAKVSSLYSLGNCSEISYLVFLYLAKHYPQVKIAIFYIENGDHVFTIANLPEYYNFREPKTLENAMICDAWSAWTSICKMDKLPSAKELSNYNRKYLWIPNGIPEKSELYYCDEGKVEIVTILDKKQLKKDLDLLFVTSNKELLHPNVLRTLITENGGHYPAGVIYPAKEYKKTLKNYLFMQSSSFKFFDYHICENLKDHQNLTEIINSDFFQDKDYKQKMIDIFLAKIETLIKILEIYKIDLLFDAKSSIREGTIKIVENKILNLSSIIRKYDEETLKKENYFSLKEKLENNLKKQLVKILGSGKLTQNLSESQSTLHDNIKKLEQIKYGKRETIALFITRMNILKETIERFKLELLEIRKDLKDEERDRRAIIAHKLIFANGLIAECSNTIDTYNKKDIPKKNYYMLNRAFENDLKIKLDKIRQLYKFTIQQLQLFVKYQSQIKDAEFALQEHLKDLNLKPKKLGSNTIVHRDTIEVDEKKRYFSNK